MRSDRLLSTLLMLQARGRVTATELAGELEVSVRTVYRDVEALSAAGVPVWTEQGRGGGIVLMPGYRTDMTGLTAEEARALVALTGQAVPYDLGLGSALATAVHKLVAAVPAAHREAAQEARQKVLVDHTGWYRDEQSAPCLPTVQEAVWADHRLQMRYRHSDDYEADYLVDPIGLVVKAGVWYLLAGLGGHPRLWRVDRVLEATELDEVVARTGEVSLAELWKRMRAEVERPRASVRVTLRVHDDLVPMLLRVTASQRNSGDRPTPSEPDSEGWVVLELSFRAAKAAAASLLGFGGRVEVLSPPDVRRELILTAREALERYAEEAP